MRIALLALSVLLLFTLPAHGVAKDPFEGKWEVTISPDDDASKAGEKELKDTLEFTASTFVSEECKKKGFEAVAFEPDTRKFGPAKFTANPKSEKEGEAKWQGSITATSIEGSLVWTKKDGTKLNYTFKGTKKDK